MTDENSIGTVLKKSLQEEMQTSYMDYAMSVIISRALPDVRDGLKPVQRRILYAMNGAGATSGSRYKKCAAFVGDVLKLYHPHSDVAVYDALVRMAQPFSLRYPLIDGQGNFGSVDGDPAHASRPFDKERDGFVPGEGAGVLVLEDLEHARHRDARIYGEVIGFAATDDAFHQVAPDETGTGPAKCISNALKDAGIRPEEVDYVNAHGTSTTLNDAAETKALKMALGEHAYKVPISSTKSMIGHLLGAAGAVEAIATLLMMNRGLIHPTINYQTPDPDCDLDYVPNEARRADVRVAISNGFGFGGQNAVVVLKKFEE